MAKSTTEHDTHSDPAEPVALEKSSVDTETTTPAEADTATRDAAAEKAEPVGRKRGRRARRAAGAVAAKDATGSTGDEAPAAASDAGDGNPDRDGEAAAGDRKVGRLRRRGRGAAASESAATDTTGSAANARASAKASSARASAKDASSAKTDPKGAKSGAGKSAAKTAAKAPLSARRLAQAITALLVIAILLAAVLLVQLIKGSGEGSKVEVREDRREAARQAADVAVARLFSFDYKTLDADFAAQRAQTTGDFTQEIEKVTNPAVRPLATKEHVVVQAVSLGSAVVEDNGNDVQVLVYLNQAVTLDLLPAPRLDRNRVLATMRLVNGQWKVAGIKAL